MTEPTTDMIRGEGKKLFVTEGRAALAARIWFFTQFRAMSDADWQRGVGLEYSCRYRTAEYYKHKSAKVIIPPNPHRGEKTFRSMRAEIDPAIIKALPRKLFEERFVVLTRRDIEMINFEADMKFYRRQRQRILDAGFRLSPPDQPFVIPEPLRRQEERLWQEELARRDQEAKAREKKAAEVLAAAKKKRAQMKS